MWYVGLRGVVGSATAAESSLETRRFDSRIAGDGDNDGLGTSDNDRDLLALVGVTDPSSCSSCCVRLDLEASALVAPGAAIIVVDIVSGSHQLSTSHLISTLLHCHICKNVVRSGVAYTCPASETTTWFILPALCRSFVGFCHHLAAQSVSSLTTSTPATKISTSILKTTTVEVNYNMLGRSRDTMLAAFGDAVLLCCHVATYGYIWLQY